MEHVKQLIIGSGPSGYTAAIYAARAALRPLVLEGSPSGGALMNTTEVENFPGFPNGITGPELMGLLREQAERFGARLVGEDATRVDLLGPQKIVETARGSYSADSVILAMGSTYRALGVPGEDALSGRGVSWCATCDGFFFRDKSVAVVGGGDTAMEEATFLSRFARSVTVVHRGPRLRASVALVDRAMRDPKISWRLNATVESIDGEDAVSALTVLDARSGATSQLQVDGVFVAIGHEPRSDLVRGQIDLDEHGYVRTFDGTSTSVAGVFAVGDLVDHTYRQAITAAASGCQGALDAEGFLGQLEFREATEQIHASSGHVRAQAVMPGA